MTSKRDGAQRGKKADAPTGGVLGLGSLAARLFAGGVMFRRTLVLGLIACGVATPTATQAPTGPIRIDAVLQCEVHPPDLTLSWAEFEAVRLIVESHPELDINTREKALYLLRRKVQ